MLKPCHGQKDFVTMYRNPPPNCSALFLGFFKLGLMGFGGVLPLARHVLVDEKKWLDQEQFINLLGICQILPGGNIVNLSVAMGMQSQGIKGAISALAGLILAPTAIVVLIYQSYLHFQALIWVQHLILGLAAAAAGLLFSTAFKLLKPIYRQAMTPINLVLCGVFMLWIKIPLLLTLVLLLGLNLWVFRSKQA
jgi:chromate transporter